jgi:hypothetical protein
MAINLIIKGNMFDAFTASHARGIALLTAAQTINDRPSEVIASCADANLDAVRMWFIASDAADIVPGFGYPAGALLFYSDKQSAAYNDERAAPDFDREGFREGLKAEHELGERNARAAAPYAKCDYAGCSICDADNA